VADLTDDEREELAFERRMSTPGSSPPANTRAQVYVSVRGGIADAMVLRGDVQVILIDWDNMADADIEDLRDNLKEAQELVGRDREDATAELQGLIDTIEADETANAEFERLDARNKREQAARTLGIAEGSPAWLELVDHGEA